MWALFPQLGLVDMFLNVTPVLREIFPGILLAEEDRQGLTGLCSTARESIRSACDLRISSEWQIDISNCFASVLGD